MGGYGYPCATSPPSSGRPTCPSCAARSEAGSISAAEQSSRASIGAVTVVYHNEPLFVTGCVEHWKGLRHAVTPVLSEAVTVLIRHWSGNASTRAMQRVVSLKRARARSILWAARFGTRVFDPVDAAT